MATLGSTTITVTESHVGLHHHVPLPANATRGGGEGNAACGARPGAALTVSSRAADIGACALRQSASFAAPLSELLHWPNLQYSNCLLCHMPTVSLCFYKES